MKRNGIDPAPERGKRTTWSQFLKAHWDVLAAADFFTVEVWGPRGLVTFYVFFVIELATRRIEIAGITLSPGEAWMIQVGRNLTDPVDGFLMDKKFVILDRDSKYSAAFRHLLKGSGVEVVRLPPRSPNLKGYASHCTSFVRFGSTLGKRRRFESFRPWALTGGSSPGCSYKHSFLSV